MALHFHIFTFLLLFTVLDTMAGAEVVAPDVSLPPMSAPPPTSGGEFSPGPSRGRGWGWVSSTPSSPSPAPETNFPLVPKERTRSSPSPSGSPAGSGDGIPFISSNPAVPLPTGVTDTATIRPLPTPGDRNQVVGLGSVVRVQKAMLLSVMMFSAVLIVWM